MPTQSDIEDKVSIDIRVRVLSELECLSPEMAVRHKVQDTAGNEFPFTVWEDNALSDYSWEAGQWYDLKNAQGNVYQGRKSLNGSGRLEATPVEAKGDSAATEDDGQLFDSLTDGHPYLTLFPIDQDFEVTSVYQYQIEASGPFGNHPMDETYRLAAYLRNDSTAQVTHASTLSVIATHPVTTTLPEPFELTNEREVDLQATEKSDREVLKRLLQLELKNAVNSTEYQADRIDSIIEEEPTIEGSDGLFEASRAYHLRVEILPTGNAFVGVEINHHARSQVTLDEYLNRTSVEPEVLIGTDIEHDPERYELAGSGTFEGYTQHRFTDSLPQLGNQSIAEWYQQKDRISEGTLEALRVANPRLVNIRYSPSDDETQWHVPQLLRVAPRKEVVKQVSPAFHQEWDTASKLLPDERFSLSTEFIKHLDDLHELDAAVESTPVGPSRSFFSAKVDRSDNLVFANGNTADVPSTGLKRHGVYKRPECFNVQYLVPKRFIDQFEGFRQQFETQLRQIGCTPDETTETEYELGKKLGYNEVTTTVAASDPDAVLAIVPSPNNEFIRDGTIDDPYKELKKALGKQSIPTQMVKAENLDNRWVHRNTALGLIGGAGGVPWRVDDMPGDVDCFIGLDATYDQQKDQYLGASANVVRADGTVFVSKSQSLQSGETFDEDVIIDVVQDVHREFVSRENKSPDHIVIHRDGRLFEDVDTILEPFAEAGIEIDILDVRKSGAPREALYKNSEFRIDQKGRLFMEQGGDYGFLTTTGRPEFDESTGLGTPRTLRIVRRAGDTDMQTLLEQVYWLSESHVGSAQRSTRLPISTYYADRCAEHARDGYLVHGELVHGIPYL
jgi:hypothetical protein